MESRPQNPEFRNNPENFHSCVIYIDIWSVTASFEQCCQQIVQQSTLQRCIIMVNIKGR